MKITKEELNEILENHKLWSQDHNTGKRANLSGMDLSGANLMGADLEEANLMGANLMGADLEEADLWRADLQKADLRGANLQGANLRGANLWRADLRGANLWRTDLERANLSEANLEGANLKGADLRGANLKGVNLDFSAFPLWCGSFNITVDNRIPIQLAYHFCRMNCSDPEFIVARNALLELANKFHLIGQGGIHKLEPINLEKTIDNTEKTK
jgi:uncharacterized protein YjbI with pentapeptide repeats